MKINNKLSLNKPSYPLNRGGRLGGFICFLGYFWGGFREGLGRVYSLSFLGYFETFETERMEG
jgi:hypothetical protein